MPGAEAGSPLAVLPLRNLETRRVDTAELRGLCPLFPFTPLQRLLQLALDTEAQRAWGKALLARLNPSSVEQQQQQQQRGQEQEQQSVSFSQSFSELSPRSSQKPRPQGQPQQPQTQTQRHQQPQQQPQMQTQPLPVQSVQPQLVPQQRQQQPPQQVFPQSSRREERLSMGSPLSSPRSIATALSSPPASPPEQQILRQSWQDEIPARPLSQQISPPAALPPPPVFSPPPSLPPRKSSQQGMQIVSRPQALGSGPATSAARMRPAPLQWAQSGGSQYSEQSPGTPRAGEGPPESPSDLGLDSPAAAMMFSPVAGSRGRQAW